MPYRLLEMLSFMKLYFFFNPTTCHFPFMIFFLTISFHHLVLELFIHLFLLPLIPSQPLTLSPLFLPLLGQLVELDHQLIFKTTTVISLLLLPYISFIHSSMFSVMTNFLSYIVLSFMPSLFMLNQLPTLKLL